MNFEKINQPKLKYTFYYNFGWQLTTKIVITYRNCNKLFYFISDWQIATEIVYINPNFSKMMKVVKLFLSMIRIGVDKYHFRCNFAIGNGNKKVYYNFGQLYITISVVICQP